MRRPIALLLLPLLPLAGCDGGGSGSSTGGTTVQPPVSTPAPGATPTPTPASFPTPSPTSGDFFTQVSALYTTAPDITACQPGLLKPAVTTAFLQTLNALRSLHRLPAVGYSSSDEPAAQAAALMMAANGQLSHNPPTTWRCYTAPGAAAAGSSNLYGAAGAGLGYNTDEQILAGFMTEIDNIVAESVGHRRWLLDPFLGSVAYGRVAGRQQTNTRADAAAIKVFDNAGPSAVTGALPDFVAYPYGDYPARFFDPRALLSFSVVANRSDKWANRSVNFANATVSVRQRDGAALTVSRVTYDNEGYGLPNNLQFAVAGLQPNVQYDVTVANVGNAPQASYSYSFRILP